MYRIADHLAATRGYGLGRSRKPKKTSNSVFWQANHRNWQKKSYSRSHQSRAALRIQSAFRRHKAKNFVKKKRSKYRGLMLGKVYARRRLGHIWPHVGKYF